MKSEPHKSPYTRVSLLTALDPELRLADVLIDDIADAELLLLPQPHQLHTLMDKDVLLLGETTEAGLRVERVCGGGTRAGGVMIRIWCRGKPLACLYRDNAAT